MSGRGDSHDGGARLESLLRELARTDEAGPDPLGGPLAPGARIGRFEVIALVGRGGFGAVYEARDLELGRHVALKLLRPRDGRSADALVPLLRGEAAAVARLDHPNLVTLHDFGAHEGRPYLVLELLRGETLLSRLQRGPLPAHEAIAILLQMLAGLDHAHERGVVHRDLKPGNVFLRENGQVKVLDFGLASLLDDSPGGVGAGTAHYMAPEQRRGEKPDRRADLFSAGVILHQALTGAFPGQFPAPAALREVLGRTLADDPAARFATAPELAAALAGAQRSFLREGAAEQPFRYLEPFTEAEADQFFGRGAAIKRLHAMLMSRPMVALVGASGAGKSSLAAAGLLPLLRAQGWLTMSLRPGPDPFARLSERLALLGGCEAPPAAELRARPGLFARLVRDRARAGATRFLLFVDQCEELFTQVADPEVRAAMVATLLAVGDDAGGPTRALIALRDDFLTRVAGLAGLGDAVSGGALILTPPDAEGLAAALRGPVSRCGYEFDEGVCEEMVQALQGEAAPLPLLQLTASRLWETRDRARRRLSRASLQQAGGVTGVLAAHAEEVLARLARPQDLTAARTLLCALVTAESARRPRTREELLELVPDDREGGAKVLEQLIAGRILTAARGGGVELSHEALARRWGRLREWLDEEGQSRRFLERLEQAATLWAERGRPRELLWTGRTFEDAIAWRRARRGPPGAIAEAFLREADAAHRRGRRRSQLLRATAVGAALLAVATSLLVARASRAAARSARVRAVLQTAAGAADPLRAALLLLELRDEPEPPGAASIALPISQQPLPRAVLRGHGAQVVSAAFSPDGRRVASCAWDRTVRIAPADGRGDAVVLVHEAIPYVVRWSPDGRWLFAGGRLGEARVWHADGSRSVRLSGHAGTIFHAEWSPDGARIATASSDRLVRIYRAGSGDGGLEATLAGHLGPVQAVHWSPDGTRLLTASEDATARLWSAAGAPLRVLAGHRSIVRAAAFSADGAWIATGSDDGEVRLWPLLRDGPARVLRGHRARVWEVAFSPDSAWLASASQDETARVWRIGDPDPAPARVLRGHGGSVASVAFSPQGDALLTASGDGAARLWPLEGEEAPAVFGRHALGLAEARFSTDGAWLLTASDDGTVRVFARRPPAREPISEQARNVLWVAAHSPDGMRVAGAATDGIVRVWRADGGGELASGSHPGRGVSVAFSPDGRLIASAAVDGSTRLWRAPEAGGPLRAALVAAPLAAWGGGDPDALFALAFSADGARQAIDGVWSERTWATARAALAKVLPPGVAARMAAPSPDLTRLLFFTTDGGAWITGTGSAESPPRAVRGSSAPIYTAAWSPDSARIAIGADDGRVLLVPADGGEAAEIVRHAERVLALSWHPDGRRLCSVSTDDTGRVLSALDASPSVELRGHAGDVTSCRFTPDGGRVVTISADGSTRLFSSMTGKELLAVPGREGPLHWLSLAPDGRSAVVVSTVATARTIWFASWSELLDRLGAGSACLTAAERGQLLAEAARDAQAAAARCARRFGRSIP